MEWNTNRTNPSLSEARTTRLQRRGEQNSQTSQKASSSCASILPNVVRYRYKPAANIVELPCALTTPLARFQERQLLPTPTSARRAHLAEYGGGSFEPIAGKERGSVGAPHHARGARVREQMSRG